MIFAPHPRPDFSQAEVTLYNFVGHKGKETLYSVHAVFPEFPGEMAKRYKWVDNYEEYMILADLEFKRRFPEHEFSKDAWKFLNFSDSDILLVAQGKKKLSVKRTPKDVIVSIG